MRKKLGQVTIFIVLIFQLLFVCLAMVMNVGLVVHDKINLQNSVDLGALYGAQKQAEILSAMAHINYQIRQSYKLLAWRYLVLGSLGANTYSDLNRDNRVGRKKLIQERDKASYAESSPGYHCTNLSNKCTNAFSQTNCTKNDISGRGDCIYASCFWHENWYFDSAAFRDSTHYCQRTDAQGLPNIRSPQKTSLPPFVITAPAEDILMLRVEETLRKSCKKLGEINWRMAASFLYIFYKDQLQRKKLIENIYKLLTEGRDIDSDPTNKKTIEKGIKNTIKNNLTFVNYKNWNPDSNESNGLTITYTKRNFEKIFQWKIIQPLLFYIANREDTDNQGICPVKSKPLEDPPLHSIDCEGNEEHLCYAAGVNGYPELFSGFYKSSSDDINITVTLKIPYQYQIFSPFKSGQENIKYITAEARAKPFGAVFGPGPDDDDELPDPKHPDFLKFRHLPNYARYPDDTLGLLSRRAQWAWTRALARPDTLGSLQFKRLLQGAPPSDPHRPDPFYKGKTLKNYLSNIRVEDPMVLPYPLAGTQPLQDRRFNSLIRAFEEAAIAPDLFDQSYYTILPNYMTTLYPKIKKAFEGSDGIIPGDLGYPAQSNISDLDIELFYSPCHNNAPTPPNRTIADLKEQKRKLNFIERQILCANYIKDKYMDGVDMYWVKSVDDLLTSWAPPAQGNKFTNQNGIESAFRQCETRDSKIPEKTPLTHPITPSEMIPHHCLSGGGRSGFSVKLISHDYK